MKVIAITGTPGTGKTVLAKALARKLKFRCLHGPALLKKFSLAESYDRKRKTYLVDAKRFARAAQQEINDARREKIPGIIIDSHLSHEIPPSAVGLCIVTACDLGLLQTRLRKRKYGKEKIKENLEAEIFQVCSQEAWGNGHRVIIVNTTQGINNTVLSFVEKLLWKSAKKQKH